VNRVEIETGRIGADEELAAALLDNVFRNRHADILNGEAR